ncbi:Hint domain-containing protein [Frigidibacter sp. ROC022]|uniref:Hint domain-containing protein n=1 Tax=Frigidibacter sp. ROC022 TaxID=2971796 RepID=UPI00215B222A|nr:Hint domain-containing protein [Frigidibacter sp. ROC022]MCR8723138.1 Hint domain-containing protein [Frigidibacter sp. ROC022]
MFGPAKIRRNDPKAKRAFDMGSSFAGLITGDIPGADALCSAPSGTASGLVAGTKVATGIGWRPVEMVVAGDKVLTFDAGMQLVTHVGRGVLWSDDQLCPREFWPLHIPVGALGNAQELMVLPEQSVMVESDVGEEIYGDPFTLIPAAALEGFHGIERVRPKAGLEVITLHFASDQVVFASAGALFFCPSIADVTVSDLLHGATGNYTVLPREDANFLVGCMAVDEGHDRRCVDAAPARVA